MDCHLKFLRFPVWNDLRFVWDIEHKSRCTRLSQEVLGVEDRGHGLKVWLQEWRPQDRGEGGRKKKKKIWCGGQNFFFLAPTPPARGLLDYGYLERASLGTECHWRVGIPVPAPPTHLHLKWKENYDRYQTRYETGMLGSEPFHRAWLPNPETRRIYSALKPKCIWRS